MANYNTVHAGGPNKRAKNDGQAGEAGIQPGMLLEYADVSKPETYQRQSTDAEVAPSPILADVEPWPSNTDDQTDILDAAYPNGDSVKTFMAVTGLRANMWLDDTAAEDVTGGETKLVPAGNGALRAYDGAGGDDAAAVVAIAREDATTTVDGGMVDFRVEWL